MDGGQNRVSLQGITQKAEYIISACGTSSALAARYTLKNNIRPCDTLEYTKTGTLEAEMRRLFEL